MCARIASAYVALRLQLFAGVGPEAVQQPVPAAAVSPRADFHHRFRHEVVQQIGDFVIVGARDAHRGREVERAREHREPVEQCPLPIVEELVAPPDRGTQRLVAIGDAPAGARQHVEMAVEARRGSAPGWTCGPRAAASSIASGMPSSRVHSAATSASPPSSSSPPAAAARCTIEGGRVRSGARIERRDHVDVLPRQLERLAAGGEDDDVRTRGEHAIDQLGGRIEDVLAVVEDEQHVARAQRVGELIERRAARVERDEARARDGRGEVVAVLERREIGEERTARMVRLLPARDLDREAGLAGAPGSGQRDEAVIEQQAAHCRDVVAAADEARALRRDRRRRDIERARWREVGGETGRVDLVERDRAVDVAQLMRAQCFRTSTSRRVRRSRRYTGSDRPTRPT